MHYVYVYVYLYVYRMYEVFKYLVMDVFVTPLTASLYCIASYSADHRVSYS